MPPFVADGHEAFLRGGAIERTPAVGDYDVVDAPAPRVVRHMPRRLRLRFVAPPLDVADDALAESAEIGLDLGEYRRGQTPPKIGRQQRVAVVRIGEPWACLVEIVHFDNLVPILDCRMLSSL